MGLSLTPRAELDCSIGTDDEVFSELAWLSWPDEPRT